MTTDRPHKHKILLVDDSKSILEAYQNFLSGHYITRQACSGEETIALLKDYTPDLILLDVEMPGMSGYEACRHIRSNKALRYVKIIMVSSRTRLKERISGYNAGVDDYIGKPFKKEELLAKVQVFLRLKTVEDQLSELNRRLNEQVKIRTEQLVDAEKMAAIGRHTAGIVHNLNSPLQVIMGNAELLAMKTNEDPFVMNLKQAADQMKDIITTLLSNSSLESRSESIELDLNEVIENQVEFLKANLFFKHMVETELKLEPLPPYHGVYVHFSQSFGNLIKNAAEAMYEVDTKRLSISSCVKNGTIDIRISDTGPGIARENLQKIFDPFFTTKPLTSDNGGPTGTGLGLASCREMIESYSGKILVDSRIGSGTTFDVLLPVKDSASFT